MVVPFLLPRGCTKQHYLSDFQRKQAQYHLQPVVYEQNPIQTCRDIALYACDFMRPFRHFHVPEKEDFFAFKIRLLYNANKASLECKEALF